MTGGPEFLRRETAVAPRLAVEPEAIQASLAHPRFFVMKTRLVPGGSQGISPKTRQPRLS
jgi:hypothetical protein